MALVTPQQVRDVTGRSDVDPSEIERAQNDVDTIGGVDLDVAAEVGRLKARDRKLILQAICHQAAWRAEQIDLHARMDVDEIAGSTSTGGTKTRDEFTLLLAPMAQACLKRVSWKNPRKSKLAATRRQRATGLPFPLPPNTCVSVNPMDTYVELPAALVDEGPFWGEPADDGAP